MSNSGGCQSSRSEAHDQLSAQNREISQVGRSDCLFKCFSQALMESQRYHLSYREQIVEFMRERAVSFAVYVDGDYNEHVESMSKQCTRGTDAEIMAAATYFGLPIHVFHLAGERWEWHTHEPRFSFQFPMDVPVDSTELVNCDRQHYDLVHVIQWVP
ncbi:OTU domain-containing protein 3-like [Corticium candelabrum]|uniref:OTU domain-containing protein 3-like n=1 Tax=Corticium candelabrum TaxID=121492 RepID=UPI002E26ED57|nr:OTU domain-containing protein 3-like [Corticium candelabrum]